ncbi:MAG: hypothetical protein FWG68_08205, partial [Defluviitaleaceae bacterium]|nr:hypothetical protein [Defluviitaleaceae bacterium]
ERNAEWAFEAALDDAVEEAVEAAVEVAVEDTRKKTWEEAREYFNSKPKDRNFEIAKNLLQTELSITDIAESTGLSISEVENLRNA